MHSEIIPVEDYTMIDLIDTFKYGEIVWYWNGFMPQNSEIYTKNPEKLPPIINITDSTLWAALDKGLIKSESFLECKKTYLNNDERWHFIEILIEREELVTFANSIGKKPHFLFPEERKTQTTHSAKPVSKKEKPLRPAQIHKERCRAIAQLLWQATPSITIIDMAYRDEINLVGCEGHHYEPDTVSNWIKNLCPNRKPGRRKKNS